MSASIGMCLDLFLVMWKLARILRLCAPTILMAVFLLSMEWTFRYMVGLLITDRGQTVIELCFSLSSSPGYVWMPFQPLRCCLEIFEYFPFSNFTYVLKTTPCFEYPFGSRQRIGSGKEKRMHSPTQAKKNLIN